MKMGLAALVFAALSTPGSAFAGWGAIAYNPDTDKAEESHGNSTLPNALNAALDACGSGCLIVTWEQDRCIALATNSKGHWGSAFLFTDKDSAISHAVSECGDGCSWRVWACN